MPRDGQSTREKILEIAHELVLQRGYAGTSLEQILARAGVTKGAFFHHFRSKEELARALLERYLDGEHRAIEATLRRAEKLTSDPLQQVLVTIGLFEEMFANLAEPHPGCLIASYLYQSDLMTAEVAARGRDVFALWRDELARKLREAAKAHPPRADLHPEDVADMLNVVIEGAMVTSKVFAEPSLIARQLRQLRTYVELLFGAEPRRA